MSLPPPGGGDDDDGGQVVTSAALGWGVRSLRVLFHPRPKNPSLKLTFLPLKMDGWKRCLKKNNYIHNWMVATQIFVIFTPNFGEDEPILTSAYF